MSSKADYKIELLVTGRRLGARYEEWYDIDSPLDLVLQRYEKLSDLQVREAFNDLAAEHARRSNPPPPTAYDPFASQIRRPNG